MKNFRKFALLIAMTLPLVAAADHISFHTEHALNPTWRFVFVAWALACIAFTVVLRCRKRPKIASRDKIRYFFYCVGIAAVVVAIRMTIVAIDRHFDFFETQLVPDEPPPPWKCSTCGKTIYGNAVHNCREWDVGNKSTHELELESGSGLNSRTDYHGE